MNNKNITTILIIAIIIIAPASFYGGMKYAAKNINAAQSVRGVGGGRPGGMNGAGGQARAGRGGFVNGEIIKMDDKSITVKMADGGSKTVYLSETTSIGKSTAGAKSDLQVGTTITANGKANADGSVIAQMVQIRPAEAKK